MHFWISRDQSSSFSIIIVIMARRMTIIISIIILLPHHDHDQRTNIMITWPRASAAFYNSCTWTWILHHTSVYFNTGVILVGSLPYNISFECTIYHWEMFCTTSILLVTCEAALETLKYAEPPVFHVNCHNHCHPTSSSSTPFITKEIKHHWHSVIIDDDDDDYETHAIWRSPLNSN